MTTPPELPVVDIDEIAAEALPEIVRVLGAGLTIREAQ